MRSNTGAFSSEAEANAHLIAAAGTATHDLPDEYDPVEAVERLSELVDVAHRIIADSRLGDPQAGKPDPKPPARALLIELRKTLEQARRE